MAAAKKEAQAVKVTLTNAAYIKRGDEVVLLQAGEQEVSAEELKILQDASVVKTEEAEAEADAGTDNE